MKHQWFAYVIVGLLSIGAGVAIAGMPNNVPVDATIIPPTTTVAPEPTLPETTAPSTTSPSTTVPRATEPDTTEPDTTASATGEPPARDELVVAAVNGANVAGVAGTVTTQLEDAGYVGVLALNGSDIAEFTTVYFAEGFEPAALRMAADLDLASEFVAPIADAPGVVDLPVAVELLVYIGRDRA